MIAYIARRLLTGLSVLFTVSLLAFSLNALTPGDPAALLLQASGMNPVLEDARLAKRAELRLDDPLPLRYLDWLGKAVRGDLGYSFRYYQPVTTLYLERLPATFTLAAVAMLISMLIALPLGMLAAYRRGGLLDSLAQVIAVLGAAVPSFWLALVGIFLFAATLRWLPSFGSLTPQGIIMPALVLALPNIAVLTRLTRAAVLDILGQEFVVVARAKGLHDHHIAAGHVLPNGLVPIVTVFSLESAHLLTGAAVVETVFAWPGVGAMVVDAALLGDIPLLVGFAVFAGITFVIANLIADLLVATLDPRIRSTS